MTLAVSIDSIQSYLKEVNRYPMLSQDEELTIAKRFAAERSTDDAHMLVTSNLRFVVKIALEYRHYGCRLADLIQEGNIGLMVAVKKFDPYKGFRLITYANMWIRSFIQDFIMRTKNLVRHNVKALKKKLFYRKDNAIDAPEGEVDFHDDLSLNAFISDDAGVTHQDMLRDDNSGPGDTAMERQETAIVKRSADAALAVLNPKERMVIESRVLSDAPESLQEIGSKLGISRERVRQIEGAAMKKMKKFLTSADDSAGLAAFGAVKETA